MENRAHALAAGLFLLLMGLALAGVVAWFQGDRVERVSWRVAARSGVPGLNLKAPVKLRGVEVGKVEAIAFDPADRRQILVTIAVDKAVPLSRGTFAQLGLQGVTGLSFVSLDDPGTDPTPLDPLTDRIELRPTLFDQLAASGSGLVSGFAETAQRVNSLLNEENRLQAGRAVTQLADAAQHLTQLVAALQPAVNALSPLLAHADAVVARTDGLMREVQGLAVDGRALAVDGRSLVQDLKARSAVLDRLGPAAAQVEQSVRNLELALVGTVPQRPRPLVDDLAAASHAIERTAADVAEQPHSLLLGRTMPQPGPGEPGWSERLKGAP